MTNEQAPMPVCAFCGGALGVRDVTQVINPQTGGGLYAAAICGLCVARLNLARGRMLRGQSCYTDWPGMTHSVMQCSGPNARRG